MAKRLQGKLAPGWNSICWVHPTEKWVIYANGTTAKLPEDAVLDANSGEWRWVERGVVPATESNPEGAFIFRGQQFTPGRAGGHLYAVPHEFSPGQFTVELINSRTGMHSFGNNTSLLRPGWYWKRLDAGAVDPETNRMLRKTHWMLVGQLHPAMRPENAPFNLNRAYSEWPPIYQPWRRG